VTNIITNNNINNFIINSNPIVSKNDLFGPVATAVIQPSQIIQLSQQQKGYTAQAQQVFKP